MAINIKQIQAVQMPCGMAFNIALLVSQPLCAPSTKTTQLEVEDFSFQNRSQVKLKERECTE